MTVAQLRAALEAFPDDMPVIMSKDAEGNGYSPLSDVSEGMYAAETTWFGERYMTDAQRLAQEDPDDYFPAPAEAAPAVFLGPVN